MNNKTKILGWTIVGIIAAIVITTVVTALCNGAVSKAIYISLWTGLILGAGLGVLIKLWFEWRKEDETKEVAAPVTADAILETVHVPAAPEVKKEDKKVAKKKSANKKA